MGLFTLLFGNIACQEKKASDFKTIDAAAFETVIQNEAPQLLDVRTAEEYAEGHLSNSVNIDVKADDFLEKANSQLKKDSKVALYCRSGRRSKKAAELLSKEGYEVIELAGGFNEWKESGKEIVK